MLHKSPHFPRLKRRVDYSKFSHYREYKQEIREDCQGRCVYCDAHENELGGSEVMTLDHFRPQSHFNHLIHQPTNLVWCCHKCNNLKGQTWPAIWTSHTVTKRGKGFINPFIEDLNEYFNVEPDGALQALKPPAPYLIRLLKLNRGGIKRIREARNKLCERKAQFEAFYEEAVKNLNEFLSDPDISQKRKQEILEYKKNLEKHHGLVIINCEMNFTLY